MALDTEVQAFLEALSPDFSSADPARLEQIETMAKFYVAEKVFKESYKYALALMIAHIYNTSGSSGSGGASSSAQGPIVSEKEGDLQRSYGSMAVSGKGLTSTAYGLEFQELKRLYTIGAYVV